MVAVGLLEDEVEQLCGGRYERGPEKRVARRHGAQRGWAMVAGQKVPLTRPRVRHTDGDEAQLEVYRGRNGDTILISVEGPRPRLVLRTSSFFFALVYFLYLPIRLA